MASRREFLVWIVSLRHTLLPLMVPCTLPLSSHCSCLCQPCSHCSKWARHCSPVGTSQRQRVSLQKWIVGTRRVEREAGGSCKRGKDALDSRWCPSRGLESTPLSRHHPIYSSISQEMHDSPSHRWENWTYWVKVTWLRFSCPARRGTWWVLHIPKTFGLNPMDHPVQPGFIFCCKILISHKKNANFQ